MRGRHITCMIALAAVAVAPTPSWAQTPAQTTSVTGRGAVRVAPDSASLSLSVRRDGPDAGAVRASVNVRTLRIIRGLRRLGLPSADLQTAAVTLRQIRSKGRVSYRASNLIAIFTQKLAIVGRIFDVATAAGANGFAGPRFSLENDTEARAAATRVAARDAHLRAQSATSELGLQITGVQSVALDSFQVAAAPPAAAAPASGDRPGAAPPTPLSPGKIRVSATVSVVFMLAAAQ